MTTGSWEKAGQHERGDIPSVPEVIFPACSYSEVQTFPFSIPPIVQTLFPCWQSSQRSSQMIATWVVFQRAERVTVCPVCYRLTLLSELAPLCSDWLVSVLGSRQSSSAGLPLLQQIQLTKIFWCAQGSLDNGGALEIVFVFWQNSRGKVICSVPFPLSPPPSDFGTGLQSLLCTSLAPF